MMHVFIVLPTQLYPQTNSFWRQWDKIIVVEETFYINQSMHPIKLVMHRASMLEYFDSIKHSNKQYIHYNDSFTIPKSYTMYHPTDKPMIRKYRNANFIDPLGFMLKVNELQSMDTPIHNVFYKRMRVKFDILMNNGQPEGDQWSFDTMNLSKYPNEYKEENILEHNHQSQYVSQAMSLGAISKIKADYSHMPWPTNRKAALHHLREFVKYRLSSFGPYQDAIRHDIVIGYHSGLSTPLNIGLITPFDILKEVNKYKIPIASCEGFIRQVIGWREYIRMKYVLHGLTKWDYLKQMNKPLPSSWYNANTGYEPLDWSIHRVLKYSYASHIERLMLLANYAVLLRIKYSDISKWFITMFCDSYEWAMLNVEMGVNSLCKVNRFMTRVYLTNGSYLSKMGLKISKNEIDKLRKLYEKFIHDNEELVKRDYRLASIVKRIAK